MIISIFYKLHPVRRDMCKWKKLKNRNYSVMQLGTLNAYKVAAKLSNIMYSKIRKKIHCHHESQDVSECIINMSNIIICWMDKYYVQYNYRKHPSKTTLLIANPSHITKHCSVLRPKITCSTNHSYGVQIWLRRLNLSWMFKPDKELQLNWDSSHKFCWWLTMH